MTRAELREFVWERCQADDHDTDEVMEKIDAYHKSKVPKKKDVYTNSPNERWGVEGYNQCVDDFHKEKSNQL